MKLLRIVKDDEKTRNIIGICTLFYEWTKLRIFLWVRSLKRIEFSPKKAPSGLTYSGLKITHKRNNCKYWSIFIVHHISSTHKILKLNASLKGYTVVGLGLKSLFPRLYDTYLQSVSGSCAVFHNGIYAGNSRAYEWQCWRPESSSETQVSLEFNLLASTLHFFINGIQLLHMIQNVPIDVYFVISTNNAISGGSIEILSLEAIRSPTTDPSRKCTKSLWNRKK